ncbi:M14 family zinc carboxypeptidase [Spirosoma endbachense]|uniref:Zinc carboxypeptidase n=1 Tax=Spirosoma endbachense TaxID=2666025 RepID=A0A6P1VQY7_9BACT|nr:M14 family zinc carboxypeptidase [Spirosoma endbachense]QHV94400.1 zinc carboxypeptidase [Spirosoma endbachense]
MHKLNLLYLSTILFIALSPPLFAQNTYYFSGYKPTFDPTIPTPEQFLGYPIGSHYTRYDQIVAYLKELDRLSDKVSLINIGKTYEERPQVIAFFTSVANQKNLEQIRKDHLQLADPKIPAPDYGKLPVVVHLAYTVHGNENSSSEAALLTAYYLTASTDAETGRWLNEAVVTLDPAENPDGRDRAVQWFNQHKSFPPVTDPLDREHNELWPGGRFNHYLNDLNRDWLPLAHIESRNRMKFHHDWYPNVMIDFHEMGTNSTYYFEPSKPYSTENDLIPRATYDVLNVKLAKYFAKALDNLGTFYWTKEQFDNLSPIYGSTYPDFTGGVGVTFEVGSSRGLAQEGTNGVVTFPFTIRNHVATGLAAIKGAVEEKDVYLKHQKDFFASALTDAQKFPTKAYVFGSATDDNLTNRFLETLLQHHIQVYELPQRATVENKTFTPGKAYVVPTAQPNYRIVHSLFEEVTAFHDSVFYDVTGWSLVHGYGLPYAKLKDAALVKGSPISAAKPITGGILNGPSTYAYVLNWADYHASTALSALQQAGVQAKVALKPFQVNTVARSSSGPQSINPVKDDPNRDFGYGSIVIPVAVQSISADSLYKLVNAISKQAGVTFTGVSTGFNAGGIDLGSNNIRTLKKPEAALLVGQGVNPSEAGEVWFLLSEHLKLPLTKIEISNAGRANWSRYNTVILVGGQYASLDKAVVARLKNWVEEGGTLITLKNASEWAIKQGLVKENLLAPTAIVKADTGKSAASRPNDRIDFVNIAAKEGPRAVAGSIYTADLDITNPLGFGFSDRKIFVFRNGTTILKPSSSPYGTVVKYTASPYVSGFVSKENLKKISNSAAVVVSPEGAGRVVLFADNPNFRSYWHGTSKVFLNALLFGQHLTVPATQLSNGQEEN